MAAANWAGAKQAHSEVRLAHATAQISQSKVVVANAPPGGVIMLVMQETELG